MEKTVPLIIFVLSAVVLSFIGGAAVVGLRIPPYETIRDGAKTLQFSLEQLTAPPFVGNFLDDPVSDVAATEAPSRRFRAIAPDRMGTESILIGGGLNQYRDLCPEYGCIAVVLERNGTLSRGIPFRPAEILAADMTGGSYPREAVPDRAEWIFRPIGVAPYPDGDILATFQSLGDGGSFPFSTGLARLAPDGSPRWFRFDFSHHWSTILPDGTALVPALDVADRPMTVVEWGETRSIKCETGRPQIDHIHVVDGEGQVIRRIDIATEIATSNWSLALRETTDGCDPLHLNYIDTAGQDAAAPLAPGDLILSLRNISAVAIVDGASGALKTLVRGNFAQQHAVQHLSGSRVLMFDNWGGDADGPPSRLLEVDLATGAERRVFPPAGGFEGAVQQSRVASHLDISADGKRAIVAFSSEGRMFEVDLETGAALAVFDGLHDLREVRGAPSALRAGAAARGQIFSVEYVSP